MREQLLHQEVSPKCFWKRDRVLRAGKAGISANQATLHLASLCPGICLTRQSFRQHRKTSTATSLCSRPEQGPGKQISLYRIHHTEAQPTCWTQYNLSNCKTHLAPSTFTAGPLLMHQTDKTSKSRDRRLFWNFQVPKALYAFAYLLLIVILLSRYK